MDLQQAEPGTVVLLVTGWLDLSATTLQIQRIPDLREVLDGGIPALVATGADWIVVPEPWYGHATLKCLGFLRGFEPHGLLEEVEGLEPIRSPGSP